MARSLDALLLTPDREQARQSVRGFLQPPYLRIAVNVNEAAAEIQQRQPDVVVCDEGLSPVVGQALLDTLMYAYPGIRRVLCAGRVSEWRSLIERGLVEAVVDPPLEAGELAAVVMP
jgi:DNA-binding NtrC family response regulator